MILEMVRLTINQGAEPAFEAAVDEARAVFARARGFRELALYRVIEQPGRYMMLVEWETLEDHTEHFRGSTLFAAWRALVGPYFAAPPEVVHGDPVAPA